MKKFIKIFALCLTLALMLSVSALAADLVVESVPAELKLSDAETKDVEITGSYEAGQLVSLEIKSKTDGTVVLVQQAVCDEEDNFVLNGIMSDEVDLGDYEIKINARGAAAQTYVLEVVPNGTEVWIEANAGTSYVTVSVNGEEAVAWSNPGVYPKGTVLTLTAIPDADHTFLYWIDTASNKILNDKPELEFYVGLNTTIKPVFAYNEEEVISVVFKANNQIVGETTVDDASIPDDPYIAGYTFKGWYLKGEEVDKAELFNVTERTTYMAGFLLEETPYIVKVDGAEYGTYKYNEKVTVNAEPQNAEGADFIYWKRDNQIVSYDKEYSFFVNGETNLEACYGENEANNGIVLVMAQPTVCKDAVGNDINKLAFYAERNVPEGYTVIESGIILSQSADFNLNSDGVAKAKATYTTNNGQFTVRKKDVYAGDTWYGKAYLIYKDNASGEVITMYSEPAMSGTGTVARP